MQHASTMQTWGPSSAPADHKPNGFIEHGPQLHRCSTAAARFHATDTMKCGSKNGPACAGYPVGCAGCAHTCVAIFLVFCLVACQAFSVSLHMIWNCPQRICRCGHAVVYIGWFR